MECECSVLEESAAGNFFNRRSKDTSVSNDISNLQQHINALSSTVVELREQHRFMQRQLESIKLSLKVQERASTEMDAALETIDVRTHQNEGEIEEINDVLFEFMQNLTTPL